MRVVEHWWNGTWGYLFRLDFWLQEDDGQWSIRVRWSTYPERTLLYASESDARRQLERWLEENKPCRRIDHSGS